MADGRSDSKIHANSNSRPITSTLLTRERQAQSDVRAHTGIKRPRPAAHECHHRSPAEETALRRGCTDVNLRMARGSPTVNVYLVADLYCNNPTLWYYMHIIHTDTHTHYLALAHVRGLQ